MWDLKILWESAFRKAQFCEILSHSVRYDCILLSEDFSFANSVDPDEMQHYVAFHQGLHCLQKYSFRGFREYTGLNMNAPAI